MKKLILSVVVAAFAVAVQAGDNGASCADKASAGGCCAAKQASATASSECSMAKQAKVASQKSKTSRQTLAKQPLKSPKAVSEARG